MRLTRPFQHRIPRRILPIPPAPALLDEFLIEIHPIGQDHVSKGARVLVVAVFSDRGFFTASTFAITGSKKQCDAGALYASRARSNALLAVTTTSQIVG